MLPVATLLFLGFGFKLLGLLARDELILRLLLLVSSAFYVSYFYFVAGNPLWEGVFTNSILGVVNLTVIGIVLTERTTFGMSPEMLTLYRSFPMLSPGQFRRLMRRARSETLHGETVLVTEGQTADRLFYVASGDVKMTKGGQASRLPEGIFVGEIGYLRGGAATATVAAGQGARVLSWSHDDLKAMTRKSGNMRVAMVAQFNSDLLTKVAGSRPAT